ncbi:MAG: hypothetical protein HYX72_05445 [Acidobacteria bacterium]|nr:hypothetical protein [Acidobacteriota bacterium]
MSRLRIERIDMAGRQAMPPGNMTLMTIQEKPLAQVYCANCHLATPTWRRRCIHCLKPWSQMHAATVAAPVAQQEKTA